MIISLLLAACGGASTGPVAPLEGHWTTTSAAVVDDGCNFFGDDADDPQGLPEGYEISDVDESELGGSFTMLGDLDNDEQDCEADSNVVTCDAYQETESGSQAGGSYTVTSTIQTTGTIDAVDEMALQLEIYVDCDGNMCGDVAEHFETEFPCTSVASQVVTAD